jgi:sugar O-acyltransferase (sialic acid O-acetyltransferase NeuD family)
VAIRDKIILQGGGEHARVVLDTLLETKAQVVGLFDPKYSGELMGIPQLGVYRPEFEPAALTVVAIGDNSVRKKVADNTKHAFTNVIHPSAMISPFAKQGVGNMILHGVIVQAHTQLANHIIVNTGVQIDHDCVIGDYVHLAPGVVICGTVQIDTGAFVGAGTVIIPGKKIGKWSIIGAGSVVIRDIPDYCVAVGNPARVIKQLDK